MRASLVDAAPCPPDPGARRATGEMTMRLGTGELIPARKGSCPFGRFSLHARTAVRLVNSAAHPTRLALRGQGVWGCGVKAPAEDIGSQRNSVQRPAPAVERPTPETVPSPTRPMTPAALQRLQGAAGNRAASRLMAARRPAQPRTGPPANVQRLATGTETPIPRAGPE